MRKRREMKVSKEFLEAFVHSGSGWINCQFCDRVHLVSNPKGFD